MLILLRDYKNLREGLTRNASKLKMPVSNRRSFFKLKKQKWFIFRPRSIHTGQKTGPKISCDSPFKDFELFRIFVELFVFVVERQKVYVNSLG